MSEQRGPVCGREWLSGRDSDSPLPGSMKGDVMTVVRRALFLTCLITVALPSQDIWPIGRHRLVLVGITAASTKNDGAGSDARRVEVGARAGGPVTAAQPRLGGHLRRLLAALAHGGAAVDLPVALVPRGLRRRRQGGGSLFRERHC